MRQAQGPGSRRNEVKEPGVLLGEWTDFTPSGALHIEVTTASVVEAS